MYTLYNTSVELYTRLATAPQPAFHYNTLLASVAINSSLLLRRLLHSIFQQLPGYQPHLSGYHNNSEVYDLWADGREDTFSEKTSIIRYLGNFPCCLGSEPQRARHNILFRDKHWIIGARFRVSHRRPGRKDIRFGKAISLSLLYVILIWAAIFILLHVVRWNVTDYWFSLFSFKTCYLTHYFGCNLFNL
jgi:hypothetical protein